VADDLAADVVAARAGDRAAFARLYQRFARAVHGVVLARLRPELVADVVQEVFVSRSSGSASCRSRRRSPAG
jgi:DNA-directed RNA polymerase specialized sigma24 family protein